MSGGCAHEDSGDCLLGCAELELAHGLDKLWAVDLAVARVVKLAEDVDDAQPALVQRDSQLVGDGVDGAFVEVDVLRARAEKSCVVSRERGLKMRSGKGGGDAPA